MKTWDSSVTHVIASTDEKGACRRTLKVLLGILEGKWILSIECKSSYLLLSMLIISFLSHRHNKVITNVQNNFFSAGIKACVKETAPVDEEPYEINVDIHGIKDGPRLGRLRAMNKVSYLIVAVL